MDRNSIMLWLVGSAGTVLTLVVALLAWKYRSFIQEKVKNSRVQGILLRLGDFVFRVVSELNQTTVATLKEDKAWTTAEAQKVLKLAVDKVKSYMGPEGLKEAQKILGIDATTLDKLIISFIESHVFAQKPVTAPAPVES